MSNTINPTASRILSYMPIDMLRDEITRIDHKIIGLIAKRQKLAGRIGQEKHLTGVPIHDEARIKAVLEEAFNTAVEEKINPVFVQQIFTILVEMSEEKQRECSGEGNLP